MASKQESDHDDDFRTTRGRGKSCLWRCQDVAYWLRGTERVSTLALDPLKHNERGRAYTRDRKEMETTGDQDACLRPIGRE